MQTIRQILVCASLAALCAFLGFATYGVWIITGVAGQLPERLDAAIVETRGALLGEVADTRVELLKHLTALEKRTDARLGSIQADARLELAATRELVATRLDASLARVDAALGEIHGIREDVMPALADLRVTLQHASSVAAQVDDVAPLFLDCRFNPSCAYNLAQGTGKAVEKAAQNVGAMSAEIRASLPVQLEAVTKIEQSTAGIAADVHHVTGDYLKPIGFWRKVWAGIKTAGVLYVRTL